MKNKILYLLVLFMFVLASCQSLAGYSITLNSGEVITVDSSYRCSAGTGRVECTKIGKIAGSAYPDIVYYDVQKFESIYE